MLDFLKLQEVLIPLATVVGGGIGWLLTFISNAKQNQNSSALDFTKILIEERTIFMQNLATERAEHRNEIDALRVRLDVLEKTKKDNGDYIEKLERNYKELTERYSDLQITYTLLLEEVKHLRQS